MMRTRDDKRGIYVHVPFCLKKCSYCDFLSFTPSEFEMENYVALLEKEIDFYKEEISKSKIESIYFGGGTPSVLPSDMIARLVDKLTAIVREKIEITVEVNPETVTKELLEAYRSCGVNRISMGVQSLHESSLKILGRIHSRERALEAVNLIKEVGFINFNLDLIISYPNQTADMLEKDIEELAKLNPAHISVYSLIIEEGTEFFDKGVKPLSEEIDREYFAIVCDKLREFGYERYEISNFSKPGKESAHNLIYWNAGEYFGLGLGSHGYLNGIRYANFRTFSEYGNAIDSGNKPVEEITELTDDEIKEEYIILNLRLTNGIDLDEYEKIFAERFEEVYDLQIGKLVRHELANLKDNRFSLTHKGLDVSNSVFLEFI